MWRAYEFLISIIIFLFRCFGFNFFSFFYFFVQYLDAPAVDLFNENFLNRAYNDEQIDPNSNVNGEKSKSERVLCVRSRARTDHVMSAWDISRVLCVLAYSNHVNIEKKWENNKKLNFNTN